MSIKERETGDIVVHHGALHGKRVYDALPTPARRPQHHQAQVGETTDDPRTQDGGAVREAGYTARAKG